MSMGERYLLAGALALATGACSVPHVSVDTLGRVGAAALAIGPAKEVEIGFNIAALVAGRYPISADEALNRYVSLVGRAVAEQSPRRGEIEFVFGVLESEEVNAFAAPGGYILVTRGSLALMRDEAELAGVLAHEIAHVDQKHVLEEIRQADVLRTVRDEAQLDGAIMDRVAGFGTSLLFTGLSRGDEMEADSLALLYAAAAGYRPDGLVRFLARLADQEPSSVGRLRELRATHPPAAERAEALERQLRGAGLAASTGVDAAERFRDAVGARF